MKHQTAYRESTMMIENVKCPICGNTKVTRKYLNLVQCQGCLFIGTVGEFKWVEQAVETRIDANRTMIQHMPPPEVVEAHDIVCRYFEKRGHKKWAFGGLQARNEDVLNPTVDLPTVRKYAAGFLCAVIRVKALAELESLLQNLERNLRPETPGPEWPVAEIEYQLRLIVEGIRG